MPIAYIRFWRFLKQLILIHLNSSWIENRLWIPCLSFITYPVSPLISCLISKLNWNGGFSGFLSVLCFYAPSSSWLYDQSDLRSRYQDLCRFMFLFAYLTLNFENHIIMCWFVSFLNNQLTSLVFYFYFCLAFSIQLISR